MRFGNYLLAACAAEKFGLGATEVKRAAYLALDACRERGQDDEALDIATRFELRFYGVGPRPALFPSLPAN
jgi:hypothetical protein